MFFRYLNSLVLIFSTAFLCGLLVRFLLLKFIYKNKRPKENLDFRGRLYRGLFGLLVLTIGLYLKNYIIIFLSGLVFFQAVFCWCLIYALIGKDQHKKK